MSETPKTEGKKSKKKKAPKPKKEVSPKSDANPKAEGDGSKSHDKRIKSKAPMPKMPTRKVQATVIQEVNPVPIGQVA